MNDEPHAGWIECTGREWPLQADAANTMVDMGLNPFREQRKTLVDVAIMVAAIVAALAVVVWAILTN